jgi:uncharacterized protein YndB with AHSA1/START domain
MTLHAKQSLTVETPGETDVVVTRRFNAPRALVWRAYTEPALMKRWLLGPPGWTMPVCEIDLRVGGIYTYRWRSDADGTEFGFTGTFEEIDPERLIVHSERPVDAPMMSEAHNVIEFISLGDMTELRMTMSYESAELRQMVLETGMTDGMGQSFDLLDGILPELTA